MSKDVNKPDVWMPLYIGDWDTGTRHLDCEQDGAYGRLVRFYWKKNGPLPDDDAQLARIVGMTLPRWRKVRPVLAAFFIIKDGLWRHNRVDEELVRWGQKRARAIEKAAAGGRAKAAKNPATSTPQALLKHCTSASSTVAGEPYGSPAHSGQNGFSGPQDVRQAFVDARGEAWTRSYIDPCGWQDVPDRALNPRNSMAASKILGEARAVLTALGVTLRGRDCAA